MLCLFLKEYLERGDYNFITMDWQFVAPDVDFVIPGIRKAGKHAAYVYVKRHTAYVRD